MGIFPCTFSTLGLHRLPPTALGLNLDLDANISLLQIAGTTCRFGSGGPHLEDWSSWDVGAVE